MLSISTDSSVINLQLRKGRFCGLALSHLQRANYRPDSKLERMSLSERSASLPCRIGEVILVFNKR